MTTFTTAVLSAAAKEREVEITTYGRVTGNPSRVIIWVSPGEAGRLYIRSGGGLGRNWTRNVTARNEAILHLGGVDLPVRLRLVTDPSEARRVSGYVRAKYGDGVKFSVEGEELTPGEVASFEVLAADLTPLT